MVGLNATSKSASSLARVNIFCDSGTIGMCKVMNNSSSSVRQTFRRNVDSLDVVDRLLRHPEAPLSIDSSLVLSSSSTNQPKSNLSSSASSSSNPTTSISAPSSPKALDQELELADIGLAILQGEREKLDRHLNSIEDDDNEYEEDEDENQLNHPQQSHLKSETEKDDDDSHSTSSSASESTMSGMEFQFSLPADVMAQVDQCLKDITQMDKLVKGVSTNGKGTVFLYGTGGVAYTPAIPKALYHKLRQLRNSSFSARPSYVSLGTKDRYFVGFNDGTADWKGPKALDKCLKKCVNTAQQPRSVSFGSSYDTFFVVFSDGSWQYQGRGIPESLESKLSSRDDRADLSCVNLGPSGEWFLKAKNGRMWWSGISNDLDRVIANILNAGNYLHFLDFGENGSYFVSYDD